MKNRCYRFCSDAGHGWMVVPLKEIKKLGLTDKITQYSYIRGSNAYLEEDCDVTTFFKAAEQANIFPVLRDSKSMGVRQSRIRNYWSYNPSHVDWDTCKVR